MNSLVANRSSRIVAALIVASVVHGCAGGEDPTPSTSPVTTPGGGPNAGNTQGLPPAATGGGVGGQGVGPGPGTGNVTGDASVPRLDGGAAGGASSGLPCNVEKIVATKCANGDCHTDPPIATFMPLTKQSHWHQMGTTDKTKKYFELAKVRVNATSMPMPPIVKPQLSADEKAALNAWLNAGAPASTESCGTVTPPKTDGGTPPDPSAGIDTTGLECYKLLAHAQGDKNAKFKVGTAVDKYMFFGYQAPWQGTVYGLVVKPVIDNSKALHHWLLYKENIADGTVKETIGQHDGGELIHGWAPGGIAMDFREQGDVSFELPGTTYGLELHYNSSDPNAMDASGVELCVQKTPTKNIATMSWLGYDQGGVIAYASGICLEGATTWTGTCKPVSKEPIHLLYMTPHLHQTGRHLKSVINGPNGSRILHDKPFDFNYQVTYKTSEVLMPGETITTTCTFSEPKCAGQSTSQEMCYNFVYAWPKHALIDNGPEGTLMHGKGVCLGQ